MGYRQKFLWNAPIFVLGQPNTRALVVGKDFDPSQTLFMLMSADPGAKFMQLSFDYNPNLPEASQSPTWLTYKSAAGADILEPVSIGSWVFMGSPFFGAAIRWVGGTSSIPANFTGSANLSIQCMGLDSQRGGDYDAPFAITVPIVAATQVTAAIPVRGTCVNVILAVQGSPGPGLLQWSNDYDINKKESEQTPTWVDSTTLPADNTSLIIGSIRAVEAFRVIGGVAGIPANFTGGAKVIIFYLIDSFFEYS